MDGFGRPDHPGKAEIISFRMTVVPIPTAPDISFYGKIEMMTVSNVFSLVSLVLAREGSSCFCHHFLVGDVGSFPRGVLVGPRCALDSMHKSISIRICIRRALFVYARQNYWVAIFSLTMRRT